MSIVFIKIEGCSECIVDLYLRFNSVFFFIVKIIREKLNTGIKKILNGCFLESEDMSVEFKCRIIEIAVTVVVVVVSVVVVVASVVVVTVVSTAGVVSVVTSSVTASVVTSSEAAVVVVVSVGFSEELSVEAVSPQAVRQRIAARVAVNSFIFILLHSFFYELVNIKRSLTL